ncbi:hypothetical protein ACFQDG_03430 [Natronoarchaeum mannanilyticum]|uniref:Ankyrin repeat domain-containing protein n=1 Tax=Natronoarchaeum mannanilyticum TaxID=926360 RepID=A0AAV3TEJ8_9EURY
MSGNPFDDLDGLDDDADDDAESEASSSDSQSDSSSSADPGVQRDEREPSPAADDLSGSQPSTGADGVDTTSDPASPSDGPAFPYDEVTQRPLYAREAAWNAFEDALELDVERTLREYDVRDAAGRELHDAALRVAAEHPEEIAKQLLELRGIDVNQ